MARYLEGVLSFVAGILIMALLAFSLSIKTPALVLQIADNACNRNGGVHAIKATLVIQWKQWKIEPEYHVVCGNTAEFRGIFLNDGAPPPAREALDADRVLKGG